VKCLGRSFRAATSPGAFGEWIAFLLRDDFRAFAAENEMLWHRTLLGYLSTRWSDERKLKVLRDSYRFALAHPGPLRQALLQSSEVSFAEIPLGEETGTIRYALTHDGLNRVIVFY